ncbi:MAG: hypothetical protein RL017_929 [Pseudomonadota bacterium]|jgi:pimeloyl-ACP methyl ester carboxylesterase|nr:alpha/beta hydrolase [Burkholderiales bacterium]
MTVNLYQSLTTTSGVAGFITIAGAKPPLVLITGYTGTLFHWNKSFISELAKVYRVYLLDNRKVGISDSHNEASIAGMAQDLLDFIVAAKIEKPILLGWSMGGMIVQEFCKHHQHLIQGMCLISSVANANAANKDFYDFILDKDSLSEQQVNNKLFYYLFAESSDDKIETYFINNAISISNYPYRFTAQADQFQANAYNLWGGMQQQDYNKIKCPVLLLWANNDKVVPLHAQHHMLSSMTTAKLIAYATGGHFMFQQHSHKIARDIINFFNLKKINYV